MDYDKFEEFSIEELREIADDMKIRLKEEMSKKQLIEEIRKCFVEYENYVVDKFDKYKVMRRLGNKGKEGIVYLVQDRDGKEYAMKTFKSKKSIENIKKEAELQKIASEHGISPKVYEIDLVSNRIVMDKMDKHLYDVMKSNKGILSIEYQKQIINLFKKLDECNVFHADSNILNYMLKNDRVYLIDFGMSKYIDVKLRKKLNENNPNFVLMTLGLVIKLKELGFQEESYSYLLTQISDENKEKYGLI